MFNSLIILIAVINFANTQETPELDSVAILSDLSSSNLDCSLKFDREFIANNEDVANAIEALIGNDDSTREPKPTREARDVTREPCEGDDCSRGRGGHRGRGRGRGDSSSDSSEEVDTPDVPAESADASADDIELRRNLGKGRGRHGRRQRDVTQEPLADGETRQPRQTRETRDATKEPCENGEDCQRRRRRRRDDDSTKEPCDDDETTAEATDAPAADIELRRNLGRGRRGGRHGRRRGDVTREPLADGETREPRDATKEPCEDGEDCRRHRRRRRDEDSTKEPCDDDETTEEATDASADDIELRRNLGRGRRGRRRGDVTKEPLADGETREPRQTREPRDATKEPCEDGEDCQRRPRRRRDDDSTKEPCDDEESTEGAIPALRRLLRGGNRATREPLADGQTREPRDVTKEPCGRGRRGRGRGRRDSDSEDATDEPATEAPVLRRALRKGGRRGSNLDATISNGIVEVAGIEGTVVFGEVDETVESIPLTLTLGETVFTCDVRVRGDEGDRVSCRATSEDDFKVRIGCAIETNEEQ